MDNAMPVNPISQPTQTPVAVENKGIDYGKGITWVFSAPDAVSTILKVSLLLLSCIFILPAFFVGPWITGWTLATIKNIQNGKWELAELDFAEQFKIGLLFAIVIFVISFIIQIIVSIPSAIGGGLSESPRTETIGLLISIAASLVSMVIGFVFSILQYMAYAVYAKTNELGSLFNFENYSSIWKRTGVHTIIGPILSGIVSIPIMFIGLLALCIGLFPAAVVINLIMAGIIGQYDTAEVK